VVELDTAVTNNRWHNLTIWHKENYLLVALGDERKERTLPGTSHYLLIDPEIYIGGGPELHKKRGTKATFANTRRVEKAVEWCNVMKANIFFFFYILRYLDPRGAEIIPQYKKRMSSN